MTQATLRIALDSRLALAGLQRMPDAVMSGQDKALGLGAQETARMMRTVLIENGSAATSTLVNSVHVEHLAQARYFVAPGAAYAREVDEGTGPAAGRAGYMPPASALEDYVKQRAGITLKGRPGSAGRRQLVDEIHGRAFALARYIQAHGTRAHPFVEPTRARMEQRLRILSATALNQSLREAFA